uniref:Vegetative cell wall protein gp1-like n=1 Tax=Haemonchus contortus TaxID=6289 RepID=A0A7I4XXZ6_HAECO|nr:unnamed protein product [Haemonchus contortus]
MTMIRTLVLVCLSATPLKACFGAGLCCHYPTTTPPPPPPTTCAPTGPAPGCVAAVPIVYAPPPPPRAAPPPPPPLVAPVSRPSLPLSVLPPMTPAIAPSPNVVQPQYGSGVAAPIRASPYVGPAAPPTPYFPPAQINAVPANIPSAGSGMGGGVRGDYNFNEFVGGVGANAGAGSMASHGPVMGNFPIAGSELSEQSINPAVGGAQAGPEEQVQAALGTYTPSTPSFVAPAQPEQGVTGESEEVGNAPLESKKPVLEKVKTVSTTRTTRSPEPLKVSRPRTDVGKAGATYLGGTYSETTKSASGSGAGAMSHTVIKTASLLQEDAEGEEVKNDSTNSSLLW